MPLFDVFGSVFEVDAAGRSSAWSGWFEVGVCDSFAAGALVIFTAGASVVLDDSSESDSSGSKDVLCWKALILGSMYMLRVKRLAMKESVSVVSVLLAYCKA